MQKHVYALGSAGVPVMVEHGYAPQQFAERRLRHHELTEIAIRRSEHRIASAEGRYECCLSSSSKFDESMLRT
jgi:hypothetical protein